VPRTFFAAVYGLRHDFLEQGRQKLHLAKLIDNCGVAFFQRLTQGGNSHSVQSIPVHPVFVDLIGAGDVNVSQYCVPTIKSDNPEPLPYPSGPYLVGREVAPLDSGPGQGFLMRAVSSVPGWPVNRRALVIVPWVESVEPGPFSSP
jgi:hypothetical protein